MKGDGRKGRRMTLMAPGCIPAIMDPREDRDLIPGRQIRSMSVAVPTMQAALIAAPAAARPRTNSLPTNSLPNPAFLLGYSGCRDPRTCGVQVRWVTRSSRIFASSFHIVLYTASLSSQYQELLCIFCCTAKDVFVSWSLSIEHDNGTMTLHSAMKDGYFYFFASL